MDDHYQRDILKNLIKLEKWRSYYLFVFTAWK